MENNIKKKNSKRAISIIMIILGIVLTAGGFYLNTTYEDNTENDNTNKNDENNDTSKENNNSNELSKVDSLLSYSGVYKNDTNEITLFAYSTDYAYLSFTANDTIFGIGLELDKNGNLVYDDEYGFDEEKVSINISKKNNTLEVSSTSSDPTSGFNLIHGTYTLNEFNKKNWSGHYSNEDIDIIIDEYAENNIYIYINKGFSSHSISVSDYTETKITYENEFLGDTDYITIEKTDTGITLTSSSTDVESLLNEVSGSYSKK